MRHSLRAADATSFAERLLLIKVRLAALLAAPLASALFCIAQQPSDPNIAKYIGSITKDTPISSAQ